MVYKTREKLIEVARQLFVHKGLENTTMNDIANASEKGRRTIYTYFKNKKEIYNAVLEHESDRMVAALKEIAESADTPDLKLTRFLKLRLQQSYAMSSPNLKSLFIASSVYAAWYLIKKAFCSKPFLKKESNQDVSTQSAPDWQADFY